MLKLKFYMAFT